MSILERLFKKIGIIQKINNNMYEKSNSSSNKIIKVSAGRWFTCLIRESGEITVYEHINDELTSPDARDNIKIWNNIENVFIAPDDVNSVGITKTNDIYCFDFNNNPLNNIKSKEKIIKGYSSGQGHLFLLENGNVFSDITYKHNPILISLKKKRKELKNIVDIVPTATGSMVALRKDGKCFHIGDEKKDYENVEKFSDIKQIAVFSDYVFGITNGGKIVSNLLQYLDDSTLSKVKSWESKTIKKIVGGRKHLLLLFDDGKVDGISECDNYYNELSILNYENVIDIACGQDHSVVLTSDKKAHITTNNMDKKYYGGIMEVE